MSTRKLLARYAAIVNRHGADSEKAAAFVEEHGDDSEFVELAGLALTLKKALTAPAGLPKYRVPPCPFDAPVAITQATALGLLDACYSAIGALTAIEDEHPWAAGIKEAIMAAVRRAVPPDGLP